MPILSIRHVTRYHYRQPVGFGEHRMMLRPRESYDQRVLESRLVISPEPGDLHYVQDVFGNCVGVARFPSRARELVFDSAVRLDHRPAPLATDAEEEIDASRVTYPFPYGAEDMPDLRASIEPLYPDDHRELTRWAQRFIRHGAPTKVLGLLSDMTHAIRQEFRYTTRLHGAPQTPLQTLQLGAGSCRDFAVLMIEAARSLGLAARFVSGYIYSPKSGGDARRVGGGHTHAWARVYLPSCGWVEFDPTNGIVGNTDLIRVAVARDPRQATPLYGSWSGPSSYYRGMEVEVSVELELQAKQRVALAATG
ncbi:MAG: transglutaminase domain protein [Brevundimonas sp.]|nr:transglutaminase domain protein [Brevundimonas sp.]